MCEFWQRLRPRRGPSHSNCVGSIRRCSGLQRSQDMAQGVRERLLGFRACAAFTTGAVKAALHRDRQGHEPWDSPDLPPEPRSRGGSFYTRCCNLRFKAPALRFDLRSPMSTIGCSTPESRADRRGPHDEIVLEVRADQAERAAELLKQAMIDAFAEPSRARPSTGWFSRTSA